MTAHPLRKVQTWTPEGFATYPDHFPRTPKLALPSMAPSEAFIEHWYRLGKTDAEEALARTLANDEFVFFRGFLGNWMPGNLIAVIRHFRKLGLQARILRNSSSVSLETNVKKNAQRLVDEGRSQNLWLLGHSRGGIEAHRIARDPRLRSRVRGVIAAQTAKGASPVMESLLRRAHRNTLSGVHRHVAEFFQRLGVYMMGAHIGARDILEPLVSKHAEEILADPLDCPQLHAASWSLHPTAWLDSFHERLGEISPKVAHDGQFFLEDLIWPTLPHVLLPRVDHAQPAMGGFGFDPKRFWLAMIATAMDQT